MPGPLRSQIVDAAVAMTAASGWASVTMAGLADRVGVSRQTVYNEVGAKPALAEAMIQQELDRFLGVVSVAFDQHPADLVGAVRAASAGVLELAQDNQLLHAVVSATHGADTALLPLLTALAAALLAAAQLVVAERRAPYDVAIDVVVRVVLSHVMQPSGPPEETADDIAWIAERVLRAPVSRG